MKIKLKDKYKKIKKIFGWKILRIFSLLIIRIKRFNIFKNEKKKWVILNKNPKGKKNIKKLKFTLTMRLCRG